jgi:hypothetical protein
MRILVAMGEVLIRDVPLPQQTQSEDAKIQSIRGNGHLAEGDRVIEFPHVLSYPGTRLIQS